MSADNRWKMQRPGGDYGIIGAWWSDQGAASGMRTKHLTLGLGRWRIQFVKVYDE